jgi:hypothetical protein
MKGYLTGLTCSVAVVEYDGDSCVTVTDRDTFFLVTKQFLMMKTEQKRGRKRVKRNGHNENKRMRAKLTQQGCVELS